MQIQALATGILTLVTGLTSGDYHRDHLEIERAWSVTKGQPEVTVAVLNTGASFYLTEIRDAIALNPGESGQGRETDSIDNDENGYTDDVYGVDTLKGFSDPMDRNGVGTFDASIIASRTYGMAPGVRVIPVAVCDGEGSCSVESVVKGFAYARSRGASIIMLGAGGLLNESTQAACDAIAATEVPVIGAAAGESLDMNETDRQKVFPADCEASNLIIATASSEHRELAPFANYGTDRVHVAAPGMQLPGWNHHGIPVRFTGGSAAAAVTAGVAALVKSAHPDYTAAQVKQALIRGVTPTPALADKVASGGVLNAWKALK